ncbi:MULTISPECIES: hypothetical protein [Cyanophyceae]|uniref:hypothetical protein n=1 Tax=Cyanophyceae TaxID=3028117 RepID=UPI001685B42A|nr:MULTISPECIES: hypothetical protein [Cyanophyceae]MBD1915809.1 hypothetical protein [Phormidium sp. FACHB-77]MBD2030517.1 hypothetical protein [Phormidium sp. FACHB-322]MBD2053519.1 hypothetical protein [Leptolyngbya sp. FACHB-60]
MAQHFSGQPSPRPPQPFSETRDPAVTSGLFWARLLTYRPLFLLGGLWLTLVCVSAIAYHGLMFNESVEEVAPKAPLSVMAATADDAASAPETAPGEASSPRSGVALWGLLSLVGLCAFGSFVLTQQIKTSSRATKRKKNRPRLVAKASAPVQPPHPKRLAPYSPQRDGVVAPGVRLVETPMVELPPSPAPVPARPRAGAVPQFRPVPQPGRLPQSSAPRVAPVPIATPTATPAVVPSEADLPLDWSEGSVAHALDMRQRRSLSSLM